MTAREPLVELLFDRLAMDAVPTDIAEAVLGALAGEVDLAAALSGRPTTLAVDAPTNEGGEHRHVYLSSVTVAGFRGIGTQRTLPVSPKPGLTVVVGRNGSGKSSFAEAIELSLTGDSARWANKNSVWRTGWRNLHTPHPCAITTELCIDGAGGPTRVSRSWPDNGELAEAHVAVSTPSGTYTDLAELGLTRALELYRPFLTAVDLNKLITATNSQLFDAIDAILGLDALTTADKRLMTAARFREVALKQASGHRQGLLAGLADMNDDRARRASAILAGRRPDLDELAAVLTEPQAEDAYANIGLGRALADLTITDPDEVNRLARDLRHAFHENQRHYGIQDGAAIRVAELLSLALDHHGDQGDGPCPVCHTGTLDATWRDGATTSLDDLRSSTLRARRAAAHLADLTRQARTIINNVRVPEGDLRGVTLDRLRTAIAALHDAPDTPETLADHLNTHYPNVSTAVAEARANATGWLQNRDSTWQNAAEKVRTWIAVARQVPEHERGLTLLKAARSWLKSSGEDIRNDRLAPFAKASQAIWRELRQESNVELGPMSLAGTSTRRRVVFPVSVDGTDNGTALGVMSQGEMQALGLATFLPRSCATESPFRFVVIDDPVQSMDPAKVDGLARVLAAVADERQIIVFTHDSRLTDALRRLEIDATVLEVIRAEQSVITVRPTIDPIIRYLDDANALALSREIAEDVRGPVVAELCRSALEAACHRVVWRVRLTRVVPHADIETALAAAGKLSITMALALFDDPGRGADVPTRLNNKYGRRAVDAYQACRRGVHGGYFRDLPQLVRDVRYLAGELS